MRIRIVEPTRKTSNNKKKVCAYVRVSTASEKQGDSLENQVQYYERVISTHPDYEYVGVFADRGITGTTDNRPEFQKMLELCRQGSIDIILTKSISRFARNTTVMLENIRELKQLKVEVRFEKENINTLSGDGEFMLTVLSSFAQEESKNISDNIKWRNQKKFQQGELIINTNRFLGYTKDRYGDLVLDKKEAKIVRRIFEDYLSGKGSFIIAKELNAEKVPTVCGKQWYDTTILEILKNEKYKGDAILQKYYTPDYLNKKSHLNTGQLDSYYIEDNHPPIVSKEMWESVQIELKNRKKNKTCEQSQNTKSPLSKMLYCSKCGATLKRRTWNSKLPSRKVVWQCSNYVRYGKQKCSGTVIDDAIVSKKNITQQTIIWEEIKNGEKHYRYTGKEPGERRQSDRNTPEKENGCILPSIHRSIRTTLKL